MSWEYNSGTGELRRDGKRVGFGYSGIDEGKNNPLMEAVADRGPIPCGRWGIGAPYDSAHTGAYTLALVPLNFDPHGRSAFRIHGDSRVTPGHASHGCVILARTIRTEIWESGDHTLVVSNQRRDSVA